MRAVVAAMAVAAMAVAAVAAAAALAVGGIKLHRWQNASFVRQLLGGR